MKGSGLLDQIPSVNYTVTDYDIFVPKMTSLLNDYHIRDLQFYTGYRWDIMNGFNKITLNKNIKIL